MFFQLTYVSSASEGLREDDFKAILASANNKNKEKNITGILIYCNNHFFQILEGQKNDVLEVYNEILIDPRHDHLIKLQEGNVPIRHFENWEMAFKSYNPELQFLDNFNNEEFYAYVHNKIKDSKDVGLQILADFFDLNGNSYSM